ncbi:MAG: hypothetical protein ACRDQZ_05650 [Mycobacteriales bacterium]
MRLVLASTAAALVVLAGCGGGHHKSLPFNERNLLADFAAASSGVHSVRLNMVMTARIAHSGPLPGMSAGPFTVKITGAVAEDDGGSRFNLNIQMIEPGATVTMQMRSTGKTVYIEVPGGRWYSLAVTAGATSATPTRTQKLIDDFVRTHDGHWLIDVGARRAGAADVLAGDLDLGAITTDVTTLMSRLHLPQTDGATIRYLTASIKNASWSLTFDHRTHRFSALHAKAELGFDSQERQTFGLPMPFGLPYQITGITGILVAHVSHWGAPVHVKAPADSTPLDLPAGVSAA